MLYEVITDIVMKQLHDGGFVVRDENGQWLLARDLGETPMSELLGALGIGWAGAAPTQLPQAWLPVLGDAVNASFAAEGKIWDVPVRQVIDARIAREAA